MSQSTPNRVSIGKFDILATYTYAASLLAGIDDALAEQRGMVAAIMGAKARLGGHHAHHDDFDSQKEAAERKKRTTITADSFDRQVADKLGAFFASVFLPTIKRLVETGLTYDEVKKAVKIPGTWGAQISGEQFHERAAKLLEGREA